jgi:two-component system response regulator MprA
LSGPAGRHSLPPTEFRLLAALMAAGGQVVRRRNLVLAAWPDGALVADNTLDQYVARLRRKVSAVGDDGRRIGTVHGVGYRFT